MKRIISLQILVAQAFWVICLGLNFGQQVQAMPNCHDELSQYEACAWCDGAVSVLNQEVVVLEQENVASIVALSWPVFLGFEQIAVEKNEQILAVVDRPPPERVESSLVWFRETERLLL